MKPVDYDSSYLLKLQIVESETGEVRAHAASVDETLTAHHGRAEFAAAEHGFPEIHANDKHLPASAPLLGLRGVNVIP